MTQEQLDEILENHKKWLSNKNNGERANLRGADLQSANLQGADLRYANLRYADLQGADLRYADLQGADLQSADLRYANLRYADLQGADIDYACIPLWCGSLTAHFDGKQCRQIAYHLVSAGLNSPNVSDEDKAVLNQLVGFANEFHRAEECGYIEQFEGEAGNG